MTSIMSNPKSLQFMLTVSVTLSIPLILTAAYYLTTKHKRRVTMSGTTSPRMVNGIIRRNSSYQVVDGTTAAKVIPDKQLETWSALGLEQPTVIAMVGLPARGKSYIVKMVIRYLQWNGFECENFNVGSHRRKIGHASADSNFFDTANKDANKIREEMAMAVQESMYEWLHGKAEGGRVAIFDATNTTIARRLALAQRARKENVFLLFVESICDDEEVLNRNYELKLQNEDYKGMDAKQARIDFMNRVHAYEKVYQTIQDDEDNNQISYIKLINVGQKVITRNCTGYLPSQVAFYLQNVHILPRKIYLSLNAENIETAMDSGRLAGGESGQLTGTGNQYSIDLAKFIYTRVQDIDSPLGKELLVLAGTSRVHSETMMHLRTLFKCYNTPLLNELRGGDLHGLSRSEIEEMFPDESKKRDANKLRYRYPGVGGESYLDVIERIRPVIIELERQRRSVLVICHLAVLRCICAYFTGVPLEEIPFKQFRRHYVYELTPGAFGCTMQEVCPSDSIRHSY